jgi:hypothetical protein
MEAMLKTYLNKIAKASGYEPGSEIMPVGFGGVAGMALGGEAAPAIANAIKPGMLKPTKAGIIGGILGAGAGMYGGHKIHEAFAKADKKDERAGLNRPVKQSPPTAKSKVFGQVLMGTLGGAAGGFGSSMLATELASLAKPTIAPHNLSRAGLLAAAVGGGLGAYGGAKWAGRAHDKYKESLKKK